MRILNLFQTVTFEHVIIELVFLKFRISNMHNRILVRFGKKQIVLIINKTAICLADTNFNTALIIFKFIIIMN